MRERKEIIEKLIEFEKSIKIGLHSNGLTFDDISPLKTNAREFLRIMRGINIYLEWVLNVDSEERQKIEQRIKEELAISL